MSHREGGRTYRLEPRDTSGVLFGLSVGQCAVLGPALLAAVIALSTGWPLPIAGLLLIVALVVCFARAGGRPAWEWLPLAAGWAGTLRRGRRWTAPLPLWPTDTALDPPMPPCLSGLDVVDLPTVDGGVVGAVRDRGRRTLTVLVRVRSAGFPLEGRPDQERLVASWGDVLNQFAGGRGGVSHIFWSESSQPSTTARMGSVPPDAADRPPAAVESYRQLLALTGGAATHHELVVGLVVAAADRPRRGSASGSTDDALADAAIGAANTAVRSLATAGHTADPLDPDDLRRLVRTRIDPVASRPPAAGGRLAERIGVIGTAAPGPLALETSWRHVRADATFHRTYWVADWPRLAVPPAWMEPLLATERITRSVTVVFVPVDGYDSRRRISRDLVKLESDAVDRESRGRRVGAGHARITESVLERERELVAGFAEFAYVGLVTVSAADERELDDHADLIEQQARDLGLELRSLDGRQDLGWASALPLGLAPRSVLG